MIHTASDNQEKSNTLFDLNVKNTADYSADLYIFLDCAQF